MLFFIFLLLLSVLNFASPAPVSAIMASSTGCSPGCPSGTICCWPSARCAEPETGCRYFYQPRGFMNLADFALQAPSAGNDKAVPSPQDRTDIAKPNASIETVRDHSIDVKEDFDWLIRDTSAAQNADFDWSIRDTTVAAPKKDFDRLTRDSSTAAKEDVGWLIRDTAVEDMQEAGWLIRRDDSIPIHEDFDWLIRDDVAMAKEEFDWLIRRDDAVAVPSEDFDWLIRDDAAVIKEDFDWLIRDSVALEGFE